MGWPRTSAALVLAAIAAGCGGSSPQPAAVAPAAGEGVQLQPAVTQLQATTTQLELPRGVRARDGSVLYTVAAASASRTVVEAIDPSTGAVLRSRTLAGTWELPSVTADGVLDGLSFGGGWLALQGEHGPTRSRLAVLDSALADPPQIVTLAGDYTFDAIARDGSALFLTHHLTGTHYEVMRYDLAFDELDGPLVDKRFPDEKMEGYAMTRAQSPDGEWIYTLYQEDARHAFVHALGTDGVAFCMDLPALARGGKDVEAAWRLTTPDATTLLVQNAAAGLQATVSMAELTVSAS